MTHQTIVVPDIGGAEGAEVVELLVAVGDAIELEQSLIVLESDKASMEIPALLPALWSSLRWRSVTSYLKATPFSYWIRQRLTVITLMRANQEALSTDQSAVSTDADLASVQRVDEGSEGLQLQLTLKRAQPSGFGAHCRSARHWHDGDVEVVELCVSVGDMIGEGDSSSCSSPIKHQWRFLPAAGEVLELLIAEGASVTQGAALIKLSVAGGSLPATAATPLLRQPLTPPTRPWKTSPPVAAANPAPEVRRLRSPRSLPRRPPMTRQIYTLDLPCGSWLVSLVST